MKHFVPSGSNTGRSVISAGDMSLVSLTSEATNLKLLDNVSYQPVWTGTPTGSFFIDVSNDSTDGLNGTFTALTLSLAAINPAGVAGSGAVDLRDLPYLWIRFRYVRTAGTGSLTVNLFAKSVGA